MMIGGVSVILIGGIFNLVLLLFQLSTGMRWVKVGPKVHRTTGIILVISGALHGTFAVLANYL